MIKKKQVLHVKNLDVKIKSKPHVLSVKMHRVKIDPYRYTLHVCGKGSVSELRMHSHVKLT